MTTAAQVLFVDDEPNILSGLRRALHGTYPVDTAGSGAEGLALLATTPYAVVVSDMMMPRMNGAEFLSQAHLVAPDAVLLILSGQADLGSTVAAVNSANLFRFLTKPCSTDDLKRALSDALRQHQLVLSERDLLQRTLSGAVDALVKTLSIANTEAFSRTGRISGLVAAAAPLLRLTGDWELRIASMLSQVGCIAVPESVLARARGGQTLTGVERAMYDGHPRVAQGLLADVPRLERVAHWIAHQPTTAVPEGLPRTGLPAPQQLLYAAICVVEGLERGHPATRAVRDVEAHFDAAVLAAVRVGCGALEPDSAVRELTVPELLIGMQLAQDVVTTRGIVLVRAGEHVNETLRARLLNFAASVGVVEPVLVRDADG